jgi:hypothetical protein
MEKFITIDGIKYQIDPNDNTKALMGADGKPVAYVEPEGEKVDLSKFTLDQLKKANPEIAKAFQDLETLQGDKTKAEKDKETAERKALEDQGKWQDIANVEKTKREELEGKYTKSEEVLGKYKETVNVILDNTIKSIPEEKRALIPADYSPRKKLEYITNNANILGVNISPINKGTKIEKNDDTINLDEESKLSTQFEELRLKGKSRTPLETEQMLQLSKKIKEVRIANENAKK